MANKMVSVIIPTYNRANLLSNAVDSVLAQDYQAIEVIVVDDGSTDGTQAVARQFGDRIKYIKRKNGGPAAARNTGIAASSGEIIALLDSDDLWLPGKLQKQMPLFDDAQVKIAHCAVTVRDIPIKKSWYDYPGDIVEFHTVMRGRGFQTPGVLFRRSIYNEIGPFDEILPYGREDIDYWLRITARYSSHGVAESLAIYQVHGANISRSFTSLREGISVYRKYMNVHVNCRECKIAFNEMVRQSRCLTYDGLCRVSSEKWRTGNIGESIKYRGLSIGVSPYLAFRRFGKGLSRRLRGGLKIAGDTSHN